MDELKLVKQCREGHTRSWFTQINERRRAESFYEKNNIKKTDIVYIRLLFIRPNYSRSHKLRGVVMWLGFNKFGNVFHELKNDRDRLKRWMKRYLANFLKYNKDLELENVSFEVELFTRDDNTVIIPLVSTNDFYVDRLKEFKSLGNIINNEWTYGGTLDWSRPDVWSILHYGTGIKNGYYEGLYDYRYSDVRSKVVQDIYFFRENVPIMYYDSKTSKKVSKYITYVYALDLNDFYFYGAVKVLKILDKKAPYIPLSYYRNNT